MGTPQDIVYRDADIVRMDNDGIAVRVGDGETWISFADCARNFAAVNKNSSTVCVGERNILAFTFTFCTVPRTTVVFSQGAFKLLGKASATRRFRRLQVHITDSGYTTYDMT